MEEVRLELLHRTFENLSQADSRRAREARAAIMFYSTDGHLGINGAFRRVFSGIPTLEEDRQRVSTFLCSVEPAVIEAPFPLLVYRGVGRTEGRRLFEALERGEREFEYPFPISTSLDEQIARRFSSRFETPRGEREIFLSITIPSGTRIVLVEPFSAYPDEDEVLILPRARLVLEKVSEYPLLREIRIQAVVVQETLPAPTDDVDEGLVWHWTLCAGIDGEEE